MKKPQKKSVFYMLLFSGIILLLILLMQPLEIIRFDKYIALLFPKGIIALKERNLLFLIQGLMLLVIIPVYILTFVFSWWYRADNDKAYYDPKFDDNRLAEYIWWGVPLVFTVIIAVITWVKTHELDPYKPIVSDKKEITIQAVALQWKWLFIYPEEGVAAVNFIQIPKDTPIRFEITADAPMNSLWIPHLGGQIYAMPKMRTILNLIANETGDFRGSSANISGEGFAGMNFITRASTDDEYREWIDSAKQSTETLSKDSYKKLAAPSQNDPVKLYQLQEVDLFQSIINKYMYPAKSE